MTIAEQLKIARAARGHTQEQAAREIGYTLNGYQKVEAGGRRPRGLYAERVDQYIASALEGGR